MKIEEGQKLPDSYYNEKNGLTYRREGDYFIPDLQMKQEEPAPLGFWGNRRRTYLKEHRPGMYSAMLLSQELYPRLREIDKTAEQRMETMMPELAKAAGATMALRSSDPMKWAALMENCRNQAREIIMAELICT